MQIEYKFLETEINSTTCKYGTEEGLNHILYTFHALINELNFSSIPD